MKVIKTSFDGLLVIEPKIFEDERGYFFESYNQRAFQSASVNINFVQDNQSRSRRGVLRGLHFQKPPFAQTKLIRVLSGAITDIVVDLRRGQPTYGKNFSIELSAENKKQLLVPKGFANGFLVTSDFAEVLYKTDEFYSSEFEGGINFLDPTLGLSDLNFSGKFIQSEKDRGLPGLSDINLNF